MAHALLPVCRLECRHHIEHSSLSTLELRKAGHAISTAVPTKSSNRPGVRKRDSLEALLHVSLALTLALMAVDLCGVRSLGIWG